MEINENNVEEEIIKEEREKREEKKAKGKALKIILIVLVSLIIGIIGGFYILSGMNKGVKQNTFMYDVLKKSGLLLSSNEVDNNTTSATDANYDTATPVDSDVFNNMTFIQEKGHIKYYYYKTSEGDNLYYYTDGNDNIFYYYASDSDGHYMKETYKDYIAPELVSVPDFSKYSFDEFRMSGPDGYCMDGLEVCIEPIFILNDKYEENAIYYQEQEAGSKISKYLIVRVVVNKEKPE